MSVLIDKGDLFNKLANVQTLGKAYAVIQDMPAAEPSARPECIQNNAVHLCDSCQYTYVNCPSHGNDAVFGDGKGNDNICACNKYRPISAEPEQRWVPCNERLPEYYEPVLTWDGHCYFVEKRIPVIKDDNGELIRSDWWVSDDYDVFHSDYYPNLRDGACIAWMPLPEPYAERRQDGNK